MLIALTENDVAQVAISGKLFEKSTMKKKYELLISDIYAMYFSVQRESSFYYWKFIKKKVKTIGKYVQTFDLDRLILFVYGGYLVDRRSAQNI